MHHHAHPQLTGSTFADWVPLMVIAIMAVSYLYLLVCLKKKKKNWKIGRTLSFIGGISLLGIAMVPFIVQWAHSDMRGHMVQHLLIAMFAPIFLVLGAPINLALKTLPAKVSRGMIAMMKSRIFYCLSHPVTALLLNMGGMYVLYLTPLYTESFTKPYLHAVIHIHFLAAGYLFTWAIIGPDPAPERPGLRVRILVLFISIAAHAFLSKFMYAYLFPLHSPHTDDQIREGAQLMYYGGDLSELLLTVALFTIWYQNRGRAKYEIFRTYSKV